MLRSMMQMYVNNSAEAVEYYQKAFGATLSNEYKNEDGSYVHAELNAFGQVLALSESGEEATPGNTMQFCFHMGQDGEGAIQQAYEILQTGAKIDHPLGPCFYSPCMFALTDRFGVNWCLFV